MSRIELPEAKWVDFSGGLNQAPPTLLKPNELSDLQNWFPFGRWLDRRGGVKYVSEEPADEPLVGLHNFVGISQNRPGELSRAPETLLGGGIESIFVYEGPGWKLPAQPPSIAYDLLPWTFRQYQNALYMCRLGSGLRVIRPPFNEVNLAGLSGPATCGFVLSDVDQPAGELLEGYYEYVLTYRNSLTNTESARSCPVRIKTAADDNWIRMTNIDQPPSTSTANEIRIYRSLRVDPEATVDPDLPFGEYYYVDTVPAGVTNYDDKKTQLDLGFLLGLDTIPPPGDMFVFEMWQERGWLSNGKVVIWSQVGAPEMYDPEDFVTIEPGQGQAVNTLLAWQERLVVGKRSRIFTINQTGPNSWNRNTLSDTHGIASPNGAKTHEGTLFFYGGDNFYRSDGGPPYAISTTQIRQVLDDVPEDQQIYVHTAVYPKRSWFLASVPQKDGTRAMLCHNYKEGSWTIFRHWDDVVWIDLLNQGFGGELPYCVTRDGHAYRYDSGNRDRPGRADPSVTYVEHPIRCRLKTGAFSPGVNVRIWLRRFAILCDTVGSAIKATLYSDEKVVEVKSRLLPLHFGQRGGRGIARRWKLFNFNALLEGYAHQIEIEYEGIEDLRIEGLTAETTQREDYKQVAG